VGVGKVGSRQLPHRHRFFSFSWSKQRKMNNMEKKRRNTKSFNIYSFLLIFCIVLYSIYSQL